MDNGRFDVVWGQCHHFIPDHVQLCGTYLDAQAKYLYLPTEAPRQHHLNLRHINISNISRQLYY